MAHKKATHRKLDKKYLTGRAIACEKAGWAVPKWIQFCQKFLELGYDVYLYEARQTVSKYVTVAKSFDGALHQYYFKVRFSDHKPNRHREAKQDCYFFVGKTNYACTTTADAISATLAYFNAKENDSLQRRGEALQSMESNPEVRLPLGDDRAPWE